MKSADLRIRGAIAGLLLLLSAPVAACTCALDAGGLAQEVTDHGDIFVGRVEEIDTSPTALQLWLARARDGLYRAFGQQPMRIRLKYEKIITFRVTESLKGVQTPLTKVFTGWGGGDCGVWFDAHQSYLVFARTGPSGQRMTSICSPTGPLKDRRELLRSLRSLREASNNSFKPKPLRGSA